MPRGNGKKGPGAQINKKSTPRSSGSADVRKVGSSAKSPTIPLELQQKCLNIFHDTLEDGEDDSSILQEVKQHLFNRDFAAAFGKQDYLRVYAARWSPSRALGYLEIFASIAHHLSVHREGESTEEASPTKVLCLGGGAGAEVVGLAGWIALDEREESAYRKLETHFVDIASWDEVVKTLSTALISPRKISQFASAAAREANVPLLPADRFQTRFTQCDVLDTQAQVLLPAIQQAELITIMFTLNELYSTSIPLTQALLARITQNLRPGAHLLVVDSPGSYSTLSINNAEKKYPMQWLLDLTLLGTKPGQHDSASSPKWVKVISDESRWFRLPVGLDYPIDLENMRYQIHLYRRTDESPNPG